MKCLKCPKSLLNNAIVKLPLKDLDSYDRDSKNFLLRFESGLNSCNEIQNYVILNTCNR